MSVLVHRNLHRNNQIDTLDIQMVAMTNSQFVNNSNISSSSSGSSSNVNSNNCINSTSTNNNINNNNINNNNNNNNDGEPKYLHKKFKKMATAEVVSPRAEVINKIENSIQIPTATVPPVDTFSKKRDVVNNNDNAKTIKESSRNKETTHDNEGEQVETKKIGYVCPYCKLLCAKPSVLQKHIRAHTNERPYPCVPCGFAFKTKSNLYKHCRSRAHSLKLEGGDTSKVSEDSDISLSDSASNGTGTPPPVSIAASTNAVVSNTKIVKTGKIYKPKFHTALQCVNNDTDLTTSGSASATSSANGCLPSTSILTPSFSVLTSTTSSSALSSTSLSSLSSSATTTSSLMSTTTITTISRSNVEQLQEHIDKIITDNQAIVEAVDPRLHKLISQRQHSLVDQHKSSEQPLNLSSSELDISSRKRCYSESFVVVDDEEEAKKTNFQGSIIKDLLLKSRATMEITDDNNYVCNYCKIPYTSADNLETHRKYYCKGSSSPKHDLHLNLDSKKMDDLDTNKSSEYYSTIQPLPSPGPLLGNTRLVDASYTPPNKKSKPDIGIIPTSLRSLEELSKYPRPNSLQMFGGEVRILDNSGETKTMRIELRQTNSPSATDDVTISQINQKGGAIVASSETSSIVVRSGLHSGGTMMHKPPGTPVTTSSNCSSISLPNTPKILAPVMPNISTPNLAPNMSCYNYFEPHIVNPPPPPTNITAYTPLQTLPPPPPPQSVTPVVTSAGITTILHGGKVIPYVPGIPGPHSLSGNPIVDHVIGPSISPAVQQTSTDPQSVYPKIVPTTFHVAALTSNNNNNPTPQPLDLASSAKFPLHSGQKARPNVVNNYHHHQHYNYGKSSQNYSYQALDSRKDVGINDSKKLKADTKVGTYVNGPETNPSVRKPFIVDRKRPNSWNNVDDYFSTAPSIDSLTTTNCHTSMKVDSNTPLLPQENGKIVRVLPEDVKSTAVHNSFNGTSRINYSDGINIHQQQQQQQQPVVIINLDSTKVSSIDPELSKSDSPDNSVIYDDKLCVKKMKTDRLDASNDKKLQYVCDEKEEEEENETEIENINNRPNSVKFLRPTSLPLKPGTFTPKKHHGITPTANTLPLISPETPRPRKSYGQLYLNGHAYTYLGLKCSTRVFYCTLNRPQPMYVIQQHGLSMYSNWKVCKEAPPDLDMAHYDSRNRAVDYTIARKKQDVILTHSSQRPTTPTTNINDNGMDDNDMTSLSSSIGNGNNCGNSGNISALMQGKNKRVKIFDGGFKSNEDYTYVRGRGRGRYVCEECGIRCKKPSMLKKHIRTHTDVRPYTCKHCTFSFKTKGNLTKHMKSKAHYKKCVELGVTPVPTVVCDDNIDKEAIAKLVAAGGSDSVVDESSEEDDDTDLDESDESGNEEQEAAQSLLSLSQTNNHYVSLPGLMPIGRPSTYPYTLTDFQISKSPSSTSNAVVPNSNNSTVNVVVSTITSTNVVTSANIIQSEAVTNRYYFPSSKSLDDCRDSVIRSTRLDDTDMEIDTKNSLTRYHSSSSLSCSSTSSSLSSSPPAMLPSSSTASQPMDLTTKNNNCQIQMSSICSSRSVSPLIPYIKRPPMPTSDILTPVSEPIFMQTIVQTMERLPLQGKEWKPASDNANGHMLQAYLTERHVMDSKMKQQYRIGSCGNSQVDKKQITYSNVDFVDYSHGITTSSIITDRSCTPSAGGTNSAAIIYGDTPSSVQQLVLTEITQTKKEDAVKVETTSEKLGAVDIDSVYSKRIGITEAPPNPVVRNDVNHLQHQHSQHYQHHQHQQHQIVHRLSQHQHQPLVDVDKRLSSTPTLPCSSVDKVNNYTLDVLSCEKTSQHQMSEVSKENHLYQHHEDKAAINSNANNIINSNMSSLNVDNVDDKNQSSKMILVENNRDAADRSKVITAEVKLPINEINEVNKSMTISKKGSGGDNERDNSSGSGNNINISLNNNSIVINNNKSDYKSEFTIKNNNDDIITPSVVDTAKACFSNTIAAAAAAAAAAGGDIKNLDKNSHLKLNIELASKCAIDNPLKQDQHSVARKMIVGGPGFRSPSPSVGNTGKPQAEFLQPSSGHTPNYVSVTEDGRSVCGICNKIFSKPSQLRLHINIHYFERPFRCESCAVSFRTKGHLTKHERSVSHHNKVSMTSTFGAATTSNPRPFKCTDCKIAFRIHGHLAKHLRSKMHIMKLECLGKLPFGTYAEMERCGINLNDIDTTDCDNSLASLQLLAQKLYEKDPSKMGQWDAEVVPHQGASGGDTSSDEGEPIPPNSHQQSPVPPPIQQQQTQPQPQPQQLQQQPQQLQQYIPSITTDISVSRAYQTPNPLVSGNDINNKQLVGESHVPNLRFDDNNTTIITPSSTPSSTQQSINNNNNNSSSSTSSTISTSTLLSSPYKCQICEKSLESVNALTVHCFIVHNIEPKGIQHNDSIKENSNAQKKKIID